MARIIINGGRPISGTVTPVANKNSIIKLIPAAILAEGPVTIHNVPKSSSVNLFLDVFKRLGGKVKFLQKGTIVLDPTTIDTHVIPEELAEKERATFVFLGPLLAKFGQAEISDPGGCKLGNRPLDAMFQGLKALNVELDKTNGYKVHTSGLIGNENIWLLEASVTGTENLILAAIKAKGRTVIYNAACEPHTQDLCNFLVSIGAKIQGIGSNKLIIDGVESLTGGEWRVISDHIDIGGWIVTAVMTGGELLIKDAIPEHMGQILANFEKVNVQVEIRGNDIFVPGNQELECKLNLRGDIDKIVSETWPGYPVDLIPQALVLAAKGKGNIKIHSYMYETQLFFAEELQKLRATLIMADPHRVITFGPAKFKGAKITAPYIIQGVHAVILAALAAEGKTVIENADALYRRYPEIIETLKGLGADIEVEM